MIINDATKLGSGGSNLVLETAGKVYIKVADRFYELDFKNPGGRTIRVNSSGEEQEAPEIDMSQYVTKKYLRSALSNYITQRGWEDIQETKHMLENVLLDGFTESINPITVETMQLIVGTECLQFDFIDGLLTGVVQGAGFELMEGNQLRCPDNYIKHLTIDGPSSVRPSTPIQLYSRWIVKNPSEYSDGNTYLEMPEDDLSYYVYIRAPKYIDPNTQAPYTDTYVEEHLADDPKGSGIATYLVSQSAIELETSDDPGYYYFLTAIITSKSNGFRSIGYMNGFTEILPGQITAYVFKTPDGTQYLDFLSEKFKIGNSVNYLDWNVTTPSTLTIRGSLSATGGEVKESIDRLNGLIGTVWFSSDAPSAQELPYPTASDSTVNWPASLWTTTELKRAHVGNHYYVETGTDAGKIFVYVHSSGNYYWEEENNSDYEYLIKAIKGRTDLSGGLILANMIQLGHSWGNSSDIDDYYSKFVVMSGINGTLKTVGGTISYDTIAAWYGGPMKDLEKEYVSGNHYDYFINTILYNKYTFVEHDTTTTGYYKWAQTNSELNVYLQNNPPQVGDVVYYYSGGQLLDSNTRVEYYSNGFASSLFRMDGTGYLAKGNISWDTDGRLTLKHITVTEDAKIGPMEVSTAGVVSVTNNLGEQIFSLTKNSCDIVGSLKAVSRSYYDPATISVIDSSGTKIADIGSQPISTTNIPTYIRKADSQQAFYGKGSVFWGTVTIPANWYFSVLDRYDCWVSGETYKVSRLRLNYDFTRISRNITLKIYIRKVPFGTDFDLGTDYQRYSHTFTTSDWIATGTIWEDDLTSNGEITTEFGCSYFLLVHLVEGGQVQSSMASDSWMSVSTGANCEATVTRSSAPIELGTYIRPNGISSVFGTNSKFQWLGAMLFNSYLGGYSDYRDKGGNFIVELPCDSSNSNQIGLRLTGYYDANADTTEGAGFRINLGSGWYKLKIDGDTLKVDASQ